MKHSSYYRRYMSGECKQVWREAAQLNIENASKTIINDVNDLAKEFVSRTYDNLVVLRSHLLELGYVFTNPNSSLVEASSSTAKKLAALQDKHGDLPLILRHWYERIECVDFSQEENQLNATNDTYSREPSLLGLGLNPVMLFLSIDNSLTMAAALEQEWNTDTPEDEETLETQNENFFYPLGGWASNNEPKGFWLPNSKVDDVFYNAGGGDVSFTEELRKAFEWGGFPFWGTIPKEDWRANIVRKRPGFEELLPLLKEGLKDV